MLEKLLDKIFMTFMWPQWIKIASKLKSPNEWNKVFKKISNDSNILPENIALKIASAPSILRLMLNSFKPDRNFPTAKDFAVSIMFEIYHNYNLYEDGNDLQLWQIRNFASAVRNEWLNTINDSIILKTRLKYLRDKHPSDFINNDANCLPELDSILKDKNKLREEYFKSFTTSDATEEVLVWLPDSEGVVHWDLKNRIIVKVPLNSSLGADFGFFRVGFDYSLYDTYQDTQWLQSSYRDSKRALETANFGNRNIGNKTKNILWIQ
jgi:hypothetical protein